MGKWLSDVNTLRNTPFLTKAGSLEILASGGEGVYYFVEQLTWYDLLLLPTSLVLTPLVSKLRPSCTEAWLPKQAVAVSLPHYVAAHKKVHVQLAFLVLVLVNRQHSSNVLDYVCTVQSFLCRLVKAGLLDKKYAKRFSMISAWAELIGYVGNVTLNSLRIAASVDRELMLTKELVRRKKVCASYSDANEHDTTYAVTCHTQMQSQGTIHMQSSVTHDMQSFVS